MKHRCRATFEEGFRYAGFTLKLFLMPVTGFCRMVYKQVQA